MILVFSKLISPKLPALAFFLASAFLRRPLSLRSSSQPNSTAAFAGGASPGKPATAAGLSAVGNSSGATIWLECREGARLGGPLESTHNDSKRCHMLA